MIRCASQLTPKVFKHVKRKVYRTPHPLAEVCFGTLRAKWEEGFETAYMYLECDRCEEGRLPDGENAYNVSIETWAIQIVNDYIATKGDD